MEDRLALEDLAIAYCCAVDRIGDIDGVTALFSPEAIYDISSLGLGQMRGPKAIAAFFATAFAGMAQNAHFLSNFVVTAHRGDTASATAYVHGYSLGKDGVLLEVKAQYALEYTRTAGDWRISRLVLAMLTPPSQS